MNCRFRSESKANASCDKPRDRRKSRRTCPKRLSGDRNVPLPVGAASYESTAGVSSYSCWNRAMPTIFGDASGLFAQCRTGHFGDLGYRRDEFLFLPHQHIVFRC